MFSEFRKTTDKVRLFLLQKKAALGVRRHSTAAAMAKSRSPKVQALYDLCKKTFTPSGAPPPSPQFVQKLSSLLDTIGPADVGLSENVPDDDRGLGFFGLNHLDRVARKVLYGSLHVKAYDWVEPPRITNEEGSVRLAKLVADKVLTAPCETTVLYPKTGGNLHCFTAITPCAVLDILSPPYREDAGRKCTYYHDYPYFTFSKEGETSDGKEDYSWLSEIATPDDLYMRSGKYTGPIIEV